MSKLIFFGIPATGHVNPSLPLMKELVRRGHEVIYVNSVAMQTKIEATGARFIPYPQAETGEDFQNKITVGNFARNAVTLIELGEQLMPFLDELIQREQPDLIMYDSLASWGKLIAEKHHMRTVGLCSTFAFDTRMDMGMPLKSLGKTFAQFVQMIPKYFGITRRIRKTYHIAPIGIAEALSCFGDITLVLTTREFQPSENLFGDSFKFIGPAIASRPDAPDFDFDSLIGSPLVYISLGTIASDNPQFYQTCFDAFRDQPGQYILSVGTQTNIDKLGTIPENFIVRNSVPQLEVLQRVDAFVTHAGLNSAHEGLYYGVPLVVVPQQMEQAIVARQIVHHQAGVGIGMNLPYGVTDAAELRSAVQEVLADGRYKENAQRLGESLKAAGGASRGADEILGYMGS